MPRLLSVFGTGYIAVGFVCNALAGLVTFVFYVFVGPTRGLISPAVFVGLVVWIAAGVIVWLVYGSGRWTAVAVNPDQYQDLTARLRTDENLLQASPQAATQP